MHKEYTTGPASAAPDVARQFDRIENMADTAERVAERLQRCLDRFHGGAAPKDVNTTQPIAVGHHAQMVRLNTALDQIEGLSHGLSDIL